MASAQIVATPRCFLLHLNRKKEIIYFLKSELLKGTVRFFRDGKTLPSPLPLSVTANNYRILRLFPLQQSLDIIINVLRRICNPVAGGWMVVGDLYDGRPRSLSRLAAGTASALSMTKPITLQSSSKAMFYGLLTVTVCLLHAGDAFSCIFKRPVILSILS